MIFLNNLHEYHYRQLLKLSNLHPCDREKKSLFYVLSGNSDLFTKKNYFYDFNKNYLIFTTFEKSNLDLCSSSKALLRLALNLFNGYCDELTNPLNLFFSLGNQNYNLAVNAILIRFGNFHFLNGGDLFE
jgi:hypothetical protein